MRSWCVQYNEKNVPLNRPGPIVKENLEAPRPIVGLTSNCVSTQPWLSMSLSPARAECSEMRAVIIYVEWWLGLWQCNDDINDEDDNDDDDDDDDDDDNTDNNRIMLMIIITIIMIIIMWLM